MPPGLTQRNPPVFAFGDAHHVCLVGQRDHGGIEPAGQPFDLFQRLRQFSGRQRPQRGVNQRTKAGVDRVERVDRRVVETGGGR